MTLTPKQKLLRNINIDHRYEIHDFFKNSNKKLLFFNSLAYKWEFICQILYHSTFESQYNSYIECFDKFILNNQFVNQYEKPILIYRFMKIQKHLHALYRFINICKLRYATMFNDANLMMEPIHKSHICLIEDNFIYRFDTIELRKMVKACYSYSEYKFPIILDIKNPYTNKIMKLHNVYNIYFFLIHHGIIDIQFYNHFKLNFNKKMMYTFNDVALKLRCYKSEYYNLNMKQKIEVIDKMLLSYGIIQFSNLSKSVKLNTFELSGLHFYIYRNIRDSLDFPSITKRYFYNSYVDKIQEIEKKKSILWS